MMKKKIAAALLTLTAMFATFPMNAFAADQTVKPADGSGSCEVVASATVTDRELEELGLNVVVSFPTEITLALDSGTKTFDGTGSIYAYGILDSGKSLTVTIDSGNAAYGQVKYRASAGGAASGSADNFYATVTEKMVKVVNSVEGAGQIDEVAFSAAETLQNYIDRAGGSDASTYATLSVSIGSLIPTSGKGIYFTNVPFKIAIQ